MTRLERPLPAWIRLMRLEKPVGIWLLYWPCIWGILFALSSTSFPSGSTGLWYAILMGIGAILMRGAGCTLNDILDRHLDAQVERTKNRPLPAGDITLKSAFCLLFLLLAFSGLILLQFPVHTLALGVMTLPLISLYPLMKRFFGVPQLILGVVFNTGIILGASSLSLKALSQPSLWLLYTAGIFWTLAYDTIYALQDIQDDVKANIRSSARFFGRFAPDAVGVCFILCFALLFIIGMDQRWTSLYFFSLLSVGAHFLWQFHKTRHAFYHPQNNTPHTYNRIFTSNALTGALIAFSLGLAWWRGTLQ